MYEDVFNIFTKIEGKIHLEKLLHLLCYEQSEQNAEQI